MRKRARTQALGTGPDGMPYEVKRDGSAKAKKGAQSYKIYFGKDLRQSIRFPPGQQLTHDNATVALCMYYSNSSDPPPLATTATTAEQPAPPAAAAAPAATQDAAVVAEDQTFVGVPALAAAARTRTVPDRFEPEGRRTWQTVRRRRESVLRGEWGG